MQVFRGLFRKNYRILCSIFTITFDKQRITNRLFPSFHGIFPFAGWQNGKKHTACFVYRGGDWLAWDGGV
jgi:hypothetical protein